VKQSAWAAITSFSGGDCFVAQYYENTRYR
jgi:hypothetical protein